MAVRRTSWRATIRRNAATNSCAVGLAILQQLGGIDGTVRLWKVSSGACLRVLRAEHRYERLDITGLARVTETQRAALLALGAVKNGT